MTQNRQQKYKVWILVIGIYLVLDAWCLEFGYFIS